METCEYHADQMVEMFRILRIQVIAISEKTYTELQLGSLKKPSKVLYRSAGKTLDAIG